jgi:hypothetical protein
MASAIPDWYLTALALSHDVVTRITQIDWDRNELLELTGSGGYIFNGSVTSNRSQNPMSELTCKIANRNGLWTPRVVGDTFAEGTLVKVERGIRWRGNSVMFEVMHGIVQSPVLNVTTDGDDELSVTCRDLWRVFAKKRASDVLVLERGSPVQAGVRTAAVLGGWPDVDDWFNLDDARQTFGIDTVVPIGALWADVMTQIASDYSLWVRVGPDGRLTLSLAPSASNQGDPIRLYAPGALSTIVTAQTGQNTDGVYNHVRVKGQNGRLPRTYHGEARDMNPDSGTYNPPPGYDPAWKHGGGPMGDLQDEEVVSAGITSDEQAQQKAEQLLLEVCLYSEEHELGVFNDASIGPGDVVQFVAPEFNVDATLILDAHSQDLGEGESDTSAISGKRQRRLLAA